MEEINIKPEDIPTRHDFAEGVFEAVFAKSLNVHMTDQMKAYTCKC